VDKQLRELERKVAGGDPDAEEKLAALQERMRTRYPVLLNFTGQSVRGSNTLWLRANGSNLFDNGSILPRNGILKSIIVQVDQVPEWDYKIEIMNWTSDQTISSASARLKRGTKQALLRPLKGEIMIPAMKGFGIRVTRIGGGGPGTEGQRSKFDAIHVMLEIWI